MPIPPGNLRVLVTVPPHVAEEQKDRETAAYFVTKRAIELFKDHMYRTYGDFPISPFRQGWYISEWRKAAEGGWVAVFDKEEGA